MGRQGEVIDMTGLRRLVRAEGRFLAGFGGLLVLALVVEGTMIAGARYPEEWGVVLAVAVCGVLVAMVGDTTRRALTRGDGRRVAVSRLGYWGRTLVRIVVPYLAGVLLFHVISG